MIEICPSSGRFFKYLEHFNLAEFPLGRFDDKFAPLPGRDQRRQAIRYFLGERDIQSLSFRCHYTPTFRNSTQLHDTLLFKNSQHLALYGLERIGRQVHPHPESLRAGCPRPNMQPEG
jgi:hypothetical protein